MKTPICDFAENYIKNNPTRVHMPGHKGESLLGFEKYDLTEMEGADDLYHPDGIIKESEDLASSLFGFSTFYSTEGSSQCIRAMMYLASLYAKEKGETLRVLSGRNAHKTFFTAAALLNFDIEWLIPEGIASYLSCIITPCYLERKLSTCEILPHVLYLTDPDYLGNKADIKGIASVCKKYGVLLIIDNAHGAYLKFLPESLHPIDLGADICCSSAHKTLPALTGGAYIHISNKAPSVFKSEVKAALSLFGSTSPSYLILESLDKVNEYIACGYKEKLSQFAEKAETLKKELQSFGYRFIGDEKIKFTFDIKKYGYMGDGFAEILISKNIVTEFHDKDFLVMMLTPETGEEGLSKIREALLSVEKRAEITEKTPEFNVSKKKQSVREVMFSLKETVEVEKAEGRICASINLACPPAVPILVPGEVIDKNAIECFKYYGIEKIEVVKG